MTAAEHVDHTREQACGRRMTLARLRHVLSGAAIDDVRIAGFVDEEAQSLRFYGSQRAIFFACGGILVRFGVVGYTCRMRITEVDAVLFDRELDDERPAWSSISEAVLDDPDGENRIVSLRLWDLEDARGEIECSGACLGLENGQKIFLDPGYHFGIRVRGPEQEAVWRENSLSDEHTVTDLDLSPVG